MEISVNGEPQSKEESVVVYNNGVPVAVAVNHGNSVYFADAYRDTEEFRSILETLGVPYIPVERIEKESLIK